MHISACMNMCIYIYIYLHAYMDIFTIELYHIASYRIILHRIALPSRCFSSAFPLLFLCVSVSYAFPPLFICFACACLLLFLSSSSDFTHLSNFDCLSVCRVSTRLHSLTEKSQIRKRGCVFVCLCVRVCACVRARGGLGIFGEVWGQGRGG